MPFIIAAFLFLNRPVLMPHPVVESIVPNGFCIIPTHPNI